MVSSIQLTKDTVSLSSTSPAPGPVARVAVGFRRGPGVCYLLAAALLFGCSDLVIPPAEGDTSPAVDLWRQSTGWARRVADYALNPGPRRAVGPGGLNPIASAPLMGLAMAIDLYDELFDLINALAATDVEYALYGGVAVSIHGYARFTEDIDLLVAGEDVPRVLEAVRALGFTFAALPMTFAAGSAAEQEIRRVSKREAEDILTLDLLVVGPPLQDVWDDRVLVELEGRRVPIVSRAG